MGMERLRFVKVVERVFICLMKKMSKSVLDVEVLFPIFRVEIKEVHKNAA